MNIKQGLFIFLRRNRGWLHINSTDHTAPLTFLLAKHITSCNNVFLKGYPYLQPAECSAPLITAITISKSFTNLLKIGGVKYNIFKTLIFRGYCIDIEKKTLFTLYYMRPDLD
jgi:hypothetical protein